MRHRTGAEPMTRVVVRARRDLPVKEIVKLLAENAVTAVPVVNELDRPMGVVSEADLLRKSADLSDPTGRTAIPHLAAWERAKAEGARAEELACSLRRDGRGPAGRWFSEDPPNSRA